MEVTIVLGVILGLGVWVAKRLPQTAEATPLMKVVALKRLTPKATLCVVEWSEYQLVLGVTDQTITVLDKTTRTDVQQINSVEKGGDHDEANNG